ncbi:hypothetical protein EIZ52_03835 [Pandoraea apista]|uniref:hypothetical protein n=1 Tax=Pandoraea apista TaxID=93218 RepID=UPI000F66C8CB|nr:hypothetical protein [Pandoraea apista]RSD23515.1 hypothetical protein EIZ52_03835 [Pandoraea apista]
MHSTCIASGYPGFVAVNRRELDAHVPLSWPLFDADGTPLLAAGERLPSEADLDWLFTMFAPHRPLPEGASTGEAAGRTEAANSASPLGACGGGIDGVSPRSACAVAYRRVDAGSRRAGC